jgi:Cu2+-exporting ATPase
MAVFDKTGTLTLGTPRLVNGSEISVAHMAIARELAAHSRHPVSRAIMAEGVSGTERLTNIEEMPGCGVRGRIGKDQWALGRAHWAATGSSEASGTVLAKNGVEVAAFTFDDRLRPEAKATISALKEQGVKVSMLSGDMQAQCDVIAARLGIDDYAAELLPAEKVERIREQVEEGRNVLMVGDGLNDAPALAAARVSMAPATAADIGRNAADFVFLGDSLDAVPLAMNVARRADRLVKENIWLAIAYNMLAVPIAILGYVTPLIAAIAMSASSLLVIGNALRLMVRDKRRERKDTSSASLREALQ